MTKIPLFLRPLSALTEEEEAAEVAEIMRVLKEAEGETLERLNGESVLPAPDLGHPPSGEARGSHRTPQAER